LVIVIFATSQDLNCFVANSPTSLLIEQAGLSNFRAILSVFSLSAKVPGALVSTP